MELNEKSNDQPIKSDIFKDRRENDGLIFSDNFKQDRRKSDFDFNQEWYLKADYVNCRV